jgi:hypothetical protein
VSPDPREPFLGDGQGEHLPTQYVFLRAYKELQGASAETILRHCQDAARDNAPLDTCTWGFAQPALAGYPNRPRWVRLEELPDEKTQEMVVKLCLKRGWLSL